MTATGIGASVGARKISASSPARASTPTTSTARARPTPYSCARPHAHATIKQHRHRAPPKATPGVRRGLHRRGHRGRQGRRPDLRLDDPFQGRLADEGRRRIRRWRRARCATSATTSPWSSPRRWRRPRTRPRRSRSTTRSCRPSSTPPTAQTPAQPQVHDEAPGQHRLSTGTSATRPRSTRRSPRPQHVTKLDLVNNRLVPNAMEPRAAIGEYDPGNDELHALHHEPEPARRAAACCRPSSASRPSTSCASIAPDVGGGFGSKIFIYAEETVVPLGLEARSAGR